MKDVRECHYHHPIFGVMRKDLESNYYNTEGNLYIPEGIELETVYQRDRRLWVEESVMKELLKSDIQLHEEEINELTRYYIDAYNLVQNEITNLNQ